MMKTQVKKWSITILMLMIPTSTSFAETLVMASEAEKCLQSGLEYEASGRVMTDEHAAKEAFDKALTQFLCAAQEGQSEGAIHAAQLSLSRRAEPLPPEKLEAVLLPFAEQEAQAALLLVELYCQDESKSDVTQSSCHEPTKAKDYLIKAARLGDAEAMSDLGSAYMQGRFGETDVDKAIACYRLATEQGSHSASRKLTWALQRQGGVMQQPVENISCF